MNKVDLTLYLVTDSSGLEDAAFLQRIDLALSAGVTLLQLREKEREGGALYALAQQVLAVARRHNVPLVIDDRADIALAVGADGVHVGQGDLPVSAARRLLGPDKIVGATAKTVEQACRAQAEGADYLGVGAIYPTTTKVRTVLTSTETLSQICRAVEIPVVAIGGLHADNLSVLERTGIAGISVVSAVMRQPDPRDTVARLVQAVRTLRRAEA